MQSFLFVHIIGGSLAIIAGYAALFASKGGWLHRRAGMLFVCAMIAMGVGASVVGLARGKSTWLGGPLVIYFVVTGIMTVRRQETPRLLQMVLLALALALGIISIVAPVNAALTPGSTVQPPMVASVVNGILLLLAAAGDIRVLRFGALRGNRRLARHLWRMCFAMFMATGSFFLGQARFIPKPLRITPLLLILSFLPIVMLFYWRWRVRRRRGAFVTSAPLRTSVKWASPASPS